MLIAQYIPLLKPVALALICLIAVMALPALVEPLTLSYSESEPLGFAALLLLGLYAAHRRYPREV